MPPEALVDLLNNVFSEIDDLTEKYDLEKIKTIGDAYMVVAGAPERRPDHAEAVAAMSLEIKDSFAKLNIAGAAFSRFPHRHPFRTGRCRGHREEEVFIRYVGRHREYGGAHGIARHSW